MFVAADILASYRFAYCKYNIISLDWQIETNMASVMKVIFELNTSQGSRIKQISMHPIKDWIGIINENNTFSLWNYQEKILIKSFSCNTLDDNKQV